MPAIGIVETRGLPAAIEAADAMLKSAKVSLLDYRKVGSGLVAIVIQGDVGAVQAAVDTGRERAARVGELIGYNVIPNPHTEVNKILPMLNPNRQE